MQINRQTYTEFFLLYVDNELDLNQRREVEKFIEANPDLEKELELFNQTTFAPDMEEEFADKSVLYRKDEERKIIPFGWWKLAAAAILLIGFGIGGWSYIVSNKKVSVIPTVAKNDESAKKKVDITPMVKREIEKIETVEPQPQKQVVSIKKNRISKQLLVKIPAAKESQNVAANNIPDENDKSIHPVKPGLKTESNNENAEDITNSVASLKSNDEQFAQNNLTAQKPVYKNISEDDNLIYFANTSFSRKTKFREVFRKASRVFEKVTTLGAGSDLLRKNSNEVSTQ